MLEQVYRRQARAEPEEEFARLELGVQIYEEPGIPLCGKNYANAERLIIVNADIDCIAKVTSLEG